MTESRKDREYIEETGWLIEYPAPTAHGILYAKLEDRNDRPEIDWTTDSVAALRFARREDAEKFRNVFLGGKGNVADHAWSGWVNPEW